MNALYKVTGLMIFGLSLMSCDALYSTSTSTTKSTVENNHVNTAVSVLEKSITATDMSDSDFNKLTHTIQPNFSNKPLPQYDLTWADKNKRSDCGFDMRVAYKAKQLT
ncbi:hypothetical protein [Psychrobacter sp. BF1]|uniref:hypothetical protein n=1 Tax=Psychrobacter sp. BF1 TaxID=2821147 RepID=UPI001C4E2524|nr:hypothetical protein [Psychrobacter sp. BF1]